MALLKIARLGNPVLRVKAREIKKSEIGSPALEKLIEDMIETMHESNGIGLAAPQVHESVKLAIIEFSEDHSRYPDMGSQPLSVFINPKITVLDKKEQAYWEGCLSVPQMRGLVHRPRKIRVDYLDQKGKSKSVMASGFLATVFQHELDHLDGVVFLDRMRDLKKLAFLDEYRKFWQPSEDSEEGDLGE